MNIQKLAFLIILPVATAYCQVPELLNGWPVTQDTMVGTCKISQTQPWENLAVYFCSGADGLQKTGLEADPFPGWPGEFSGVVFPQTPIIVDLDHDGLMEVVAYGREYDTGGNYVQSLIYALDDDGSVLPGFPRAYESAWTPNVADFDNTGEYEIIFTYQHRGILYCLDRYGNDEPGWPISIPTEIWQSLGACGTVGDLDGDGYLEFLIKGAKNIHSYRHDGSIQPGFPIPLLDTTYFYNPWLAPSLADIDLDGQPEILVAADSGGPGPPRSAYIAVYEPDGQLKAGWPLRYPGAFTWQMPTAADINGDGIPEIGFTLSDHFTYFVDGDGQNLPGWPVQFFSPEGYHRDAMSDLIAIDIDGDGDCEIFSDYNWAHMDSCSPDSTIFYGHSWLFAADHLGNDLPGYPIQVPGAYLWNPPTFALRPDSNRLIMGLSTWLYWWDIEHPEDFEAGYIEVFQFPDSTGPTDQWPMLGHDNLMTRNYNFVDNVTGIADGPPPLPKNYVLKQNYPNPFNSATIIEFALPKEEEISFDVYDVLGRKVAELAEGVYPAGHHRAKWDASKYATGIYFCVLQTPRTNISRKMVVLK